MFMIIIIIIIMKIVMCERKKTRADSESTQKNNQEKFANCIAQYYNTL